MKLGKILESIGDIDIDQITETIKGGDRFLDTGTEYYAIILSDEFFKRDRVRTGRNVLSSLNYSYVTAHLILLVLDR
jgi:hypothetical protein